jgi:hypothetical protein
MNKKPKKTWNSITLTLLFKLAFTILVVGFARRWGYEITDSQANDIVVGSMMGNILYELWGLSKQGVVE